MTRRNMRVARHASPLTPPLNHNFIEDSSIDFFLPRKLLWRELALQASVHQELVFTIVKVPKFACVLYEVGIGIRCLASDN